MYLVDKNKRPGICVKLFILYYAQPLLSFIKSFDKISSIIAKKCFKIILIQKKQIFNFLGATTLHNDTKKSQKNHIVYALTRCVSTQKPVNMRFVMPYMFLYVNLSLKCYPCL